MIFKPVAVGNYMKALRLINGEKIFEQAERLGISSSQVSKYQRGDCTNQKEEDLCENIINAYALNKTQTAALQHSQKLNRNVRNSITSKESA